MRKKKMTAQNQALVGLCARYNRPIIRPMSGHRRPATPLLSISTRHVTDGMVTRPVKVVVEEEQLVCARACVSVGLWVCVSVCLCLCTPSR
jgi:hypothetical protein